VIARQSVIAETICVLVARIVSCPQKQLKTSDDSNEIEY
jgi:hypothetical protein